jgi:hypothetical protein
MEKSEVLLWPKIDVPATASTEMLIWILSAKLDVNTCAAASHAAFAAAAFAPKFVVKAAVNVGLMTSIFGFPYGFEILYTV